MKRYALALLAAICAASSLLAPASASAQLEEDLMPETRKFASPERFALEFRIGPYNPNMGGNDAFDTFFADDSGPLLALELDIIAYRIELERDDGAAHVLVVDRGDRRRILRCGVADGEGFAHDSYALSPCEAMSRPSRSASASTRRPTVYFTIRNASSATTLDRTTVMSTPCAWIHTCVPML